MLTFKGLVCLRHHRHRLNLWSLFIRIKIIFTCYSLVYRIPFQIQKLLEHVVGCCTQCTLSSTVFVWTEQHDAHSLPENNINDKIKHGKYSDFYDEDQSLSIVLCQSVAIYKMKICDINLWASLNLRLLNLNENLPPFQVPHISGEDDSDRRSFSCLPEKRLIFLRFFL